MFVVPAKHEANRFFRDSIIIGLTGCAGFAFVIWLLVSAMFIRPISERQYQLATEKVSLYLSGARIVLDQHKHPGAFYHLPFSNKLSPEDVATVEKLKFVPHRFLTLTKGCPPDLLCLNDLDRFYKVEIDYIKNGERLTTYLIMQLESYSGVWAIYKDPRLEKFKAEV